MKASELRIGNIVIYPGYKRNGADKYWTVRDLYFESEKIGLTDGAIQTTTRFESINAIPLTEQWLIRLGFEVKVNQYFKPGMIEDITYHYDGLCTYNLNERVIKHVHQLQNLYFALTGEELIIT